MKILVEEKLEFGHEKKDLGVIGDAEFKFVGLEMRFERNKKKY